VAVVPSVHNTRFGQAICRTDLIRLRVVTLTNLVVTVVQEVDYIHSRRYLEPKTECDAATITARGAVVIS